MNVMNDVIQPIVIQSHGFVCRQVHSADVTQCAWWEPVTAWPTLLACFVWSVTVVWSRQHHLASRLCDVTPSCLASISWSNDLFKKKKLMTSIVLSSFYLMFVIHHMFIYWIGLILYWLQRRVVSVGSHSLYSDLVLLFEHDRWGLWCTIAGY